MRVYACSVYIYVCFIHPLLAVTYPCAHIGFIAHSSPCSVPRNPSGFKKRCKIKAKKGQMKGHNQGVSAIRETQSFTRNLEPILRESFFFPNFPLLVCLSVCLFRCMSLSFFVCLLALCSQSVYLSVSVF